MDEQASSEKAVEEGVQASFLFGREKALASRGDIPMDEIVGSGKTVVEDSPSKAQEARVAWEFPPPFQGIRERRGRRTMGSMGCGLNGSKSRFNRKSSSMEGVHRRVSGRPFGDGGWLARIAAASRG